MRSYKILSIVILLAFVSFFKCKKEDSINPPSNLIYGIASINADMGIGGSSVNASVKWNGETGKYAIVSEQITGVSIDKNTGQISWTAETPSGTYSIKVEASNSSGAITTIYTLVIREISYTITFDSNGGNAMANTKLVIIYPNNVIQSTDFIRPTHTNLNYIFAGWTFVKNAKDTIVYNVTKINVDVTLYAKWIDKANTKFNVTFDINGGDGSNPTVQQVSYSDPAIAPTPPPSFMGYNFIGWFTAKTDGIQIQDFTQTFIQSDTTFYARWSIKKYIIIFDANEGAVGSGTDYTQTINYGTTPIKPTNNPTRVGHKFLGWYEAKSGGTPITTFSVAATDKTYYAQWEAEKYTVKFELNGGTHATSSTHPYEQTIQYNDKAQQPNNPIAPSGQNFAGWFTAMSGGNQITDFTITKDVSFYAQYTNVPTYTVTFDANGGSSNSNFTQTVSQNNKVSVPTTPIRTGYTFANWTTDETGNNAFDFNSTTITSAITLYAQWTANQYTITFDANEGIVGSGTDYTQTITYGTIPTKPTNNPTRVGHKFLGWYEAKSGGTLITTFSVAATDKTYYAQWEAEKYTVTYDNKGKGVAPSAVIANYNTSISAPTEPTVANGDYIFKGWFMSTDGGTTLSTTVFDFSTEKITENITLYAKWYPKWTNEKWTVTGTGLLGGTFDTDSNPFEYDENTDTYIIKSIDLVANIGGIKFRQNDLANRWTNAAGGTNDILNYNSTSSNITIAANGTYKITFDIPNSKYKLDKLSDLNPVAKVITFNVQGGELTKTSAISVKSGIETDITNLVGTTSRIGDYRFGGWYKSDNNGTTYQDPIYSLDKINTTSDITLYAVWIPNWSDENWSIIGDFNGWTDTKLTYNKLSKFYEVTIDVPSGGTNFKIRKDGKWSSQGGSEKGGNNTTDQKLYSNGSDINIPDAGRYLVRISLNFDGFGDRYDITKQ